MLNTCVKTLPYGTRNARNAIGIALPTRELRAVVHGVDVVLEVVLLAHARLLLLLLARPNLLEVGHDVVASATGASS